MSQNAKGVPGCEYLYQRGNRYMVRVQVPRELRASLGKSEFKRSMGGDLAVARRKRHLVVAEVVGLFDAARRQLGRTNAASSVVGLKPSGEDVERACYEHFRRMVQNMRGKVADGHGDAPREVSNRAEGFRSMIEHHAMFSAMDGWSIMGTEARWLSEEKGWSIEENSERFEQLCRLMLRARLQCYRDELRRLEANFSVDVNADPQFGPQPPKLRLPPPTLGDLIDRFTSNREAEWSASTKRNYTIINRVIVEVCGRDTSLDQIDDEFCQNVRSVLKTLPSNYQKHPAMKGRQIPEAISIAAARGLPVISPATINGHLTKLAAVIRFGREKGWITGNPMAGVEVHDPIDPSEKRDPFSTDHLNAIFSTDPWREPFNPASITPSRYWAPIIGMYTGARLTDICGQLVEEMIALDGVKLFEFVHRPNERHIKGGKGRRVPVHPALLAMGLWDFVEDARRSGRRQLFPDVKGDLVGKWGDNTSKWFSRKVKHLNLRGRKLSFHSLRHSFEDAMRRADLHGTPIGDAITGRWTPGVSKNYGSKYPVERLAEAIGMISYPGLRLRAEAVTEPVTASVIANSIVT